MSRINITPLVDVSLSLVVMFIVAVPVLIESGIFVNTPSRVQKVEKKEDIDEFKVNIYIKSDGRYLLNEEEVSFEKLLELIPQLLERSRDKKVIISADGRVMYEKVIEILDISKQAGARDLVILKRN